MWTRNRKIPGFLPLGTVFSGFQNHRDTGCRHLSADRKALQILAFPKNVSYWLIQWSKSKIDLRKRGIIQNPMSREPKARDIPERRWGNAKLIRTDGWQCLHHKMDVRSTGDSEFFKRWSHRRRQYDQSDPELLRKYDCIRTGKTVCSEQRYCRQDKSIKTKMS